MLRRQMLGVGGVLLAPDDVAVGGEPAPAETTDQSDAAADQAEETVDESPQEGEDADTADATTTEQETDEGSTPDGTPAKPNSRDKAVPLAALIETRKTFQKQIEALEQQIAEMRPAEKDPLDEFLANLPENPDPDSPEGREAADIKALAPLLKKLKPVLMPEITTHKRMLAAAAQGMDRMRFMLEQLIGAIPKDKLPAGIKALPKIDEHRKATYEKTKRIVGHADAFQALQEQLTAEAEAESGREASIRTDERVKTQKSIQQHRSASRATGPGNVAAPPRGAQPPKKRTFEQMEKERLAGKDFVIR